MSLVLSILALRIASLALVFCMCGEGIRRVWIPIAQWRESESKGSCSGRLAVALHENAELAGRIRKLNKPLRPSPAPRVEYVDGR
jgi:hypothetical protein